MCGLLMLKNYPHKAGWLFFSYSAIILSWRKRCWNNFSSWGDALTTGRKRIRGGVSAKNITAPLRGSAPKTV